MKTDEATGGILVFLFGAGTIFFSMKMPLGDFRSPGSGLFPLCLGILLMLLSGISVLTALVRDREGKTRDKGPAVSQFPRSVRQVLIFLGTMGAATLLLKPLGYPVVSFLLMLALLRTLGMKAWGWNILLAFLTAAVSYLLFVRTLMIPLPRGWLGL